MKFAKIQTSVLTKLNLVGSSLVLLVGTSVIPYVATHGVLAQTASELRSQSNQLQDLIDQNKQAADNLSVEVNTLQNKIAELDGAINETVAQINATEQKIAELSVELDKTQADLDKQQEILKTNLKQLYKTTGATSVELLFSSDNFSTFINKQQYLDRLKSGIKSSLDAVMALKKTLEAKKAEQEQLQASLVLRKSGLESTKAERTALLEQTQGEEAKYRAMVDELKNQQREINKKLASMATSINYYGNGSYPWANVGGSNFDFYSCYGYDPWGMCYRQCVSYTAWRVATSGRYMPTNWIAGRGNANRWVQSAMEDGIPVDKNPRPGDVAVWSQGFYGHAMYVEDVYDNGMIRVSQYNFGTPGTYSEMTIPANYNNMSYIHFQ